ncbi:MAG TPA: TonB family protein [Myxococcus sp.]|jgi:protein TonB|nr:TonB family protein [Myxococcus sp.]
MFKSVIERQRAGRLGAGMSVSMGVHAALFAAVLFISMRPPEPPQEPEKDYVIKLPPAPGHRQPKGTPPSTPVKQAAVPKKPRRDPLAMPQQVQPRPPESDTKQPEPANTGDAPATGDSGPVGHPDGDPNAIGLPYVPGLPAGGGGEGTGTEVLPFGMGMTPPNLVSGPNVDYTPQALVAGVEGTMLVKCVITLEGKVRNCRVIKGLPHMDEAVVDALESRHYRPVTFQGRAVSVSYVFTLRFKRPR